MLPGTSGLIVGPSLFVTIGVVFRCLNREKNYNLDPKGVPGAFKPFLAHYIRSSEFVVGLATGSIVLLKRLNFLKYVSPTFQIGKSLLMGSEDVWVRSPTWTQL